MFRVLGTLVTLCTTCFVLAGCAGIPVPDKPRENVTPLLQQNLPQQFFNAEGEPLPMSSSWWQGFEDPDLTRLIETALTENRQLDVAQANINIARTSVARQRLETSYETQGNLGPNVGRSAAPDRDIAATLSSGLGASWEYDAFGRIASAIEASELGADAAEQARRDVAVIVSSQTALVYADLRGAQRRLSVAQENADTQEQSLELLQTLLENGRATALDINRAEAQYRTTLADIPRFQATIDSSVSRLAVLTGSSALTPGAEILNLSQQARPIPELTSGLDIGSPESLLRRRPDIRFAEIEIARLLALSDVERARLFPVVSFNANILSLFGNGNRLDQLSSFGFGFGPAISWEGPDLRRVRADIDVADAETERAYQQYEQTVLQAFSDVEISLSNLRNEARRQQDLSLAVDAARGALELAQVRFEEGFDDFLDVLDAQRTLLAAEDRLAENTLQTTRLTIAAYQELGGI
jgi:multidrug efflux system outer membrane protein